MEESTKEEQGKMETKKVGIFTEEIAPDTAREMIGRSIGNRPIRGGKVQEYAADMRRGLWRCEPGIEPIQISTDGKLMNGHHRLMSVIEYGSGVPFRIEYGVSSEVMDYIDRNAPRSIGDIMAISYGWTCARNRVAIINAIHRYGASVKQLRRTLAVSEVVLLGEIYETHIGEIGPYRKSPVTASMMAACVRARRSGESLDGILSFLDVVKTGLPAEGRDSSGALLLTRFVLEGARRKSHGGSAGSQITGLTERALFAHLRGDRLKILRPYSYRLWPTPESERIS